jgi:hypothetical protein
MTRTVVAVGMIRVFLLETRGIPEDDGGQVRSPRRAVHGATETQSYERGQVATVIQMTVAENNGVELRRVEGWCRLIAAAQLLRALKHSAIQQHLPVVDADEVPGASDRAGRAGKRQLKSPRAHDGCPFVRALWASQEHAIAGDWASGPGRAQAAISS